jgi:hypothetical protein
MRSSEVRRFAGSDASAPPLPTTFEFSRDIARSVSAQSAL